MISKYTVPSGADLGLSRKCCFSIYEEHVWQRIKRNHFESVSQYFNLAIEGVAFGL